MTVRTKESGSRVRRLMIRAKPQTGYAILGRTFLQDQRLVGDAGWMASYLLSQVEHWEVRVPVLTEFTRWSRDRVYRALKVLVQCGYAARRKTKGDDGLFDGVEYVVCDDPKEIDCVRAEWAEQGTPALDDLPAPARRKSSNAPCPESPDTVVPYTDATDDIDNIDTQKLTPLCPPAAVGARASQPPSDGTAISKEIRPSSGTLRSPTTDPTRGEPEGLAGKALEQNSVPEPVTIGNVKYAYETINSRNMRKSDAELAALTPVELAALWQSLDQLVATHARLNKRPPELWYYARTKGFRQFPPKKTGGDPDAVLARERPPEVDAVLAGPIGLRAANGRWVQELTEFIAAQRRVPNDIECARLEREGGARHQQLLADERAIAEKRLVSPGVPVFLGKRRNLIAKALRMHGREPPSSDADPPRQAARAETDEMADFT